MAYSHKEVRCNIKWLRTRVCPPHAGVIRRTPRPSRSGPCLSPARGGDPKEFLEATPEELSVPRARG